MPSNRLLLLSLMAMSGLGAEPVLSPQDRAWHRVQREFERTLGDLLRPVVDAGLYTRIVLKPRHGAWREVRDLVERGRPFRDRLRHIERRSDTLVNLDVAHPVWFTEETDHLHSVERFVVPLGVLVATPRRGPVRHTEALLLLEFIGGEPRLAEGVGDLCHHLVKRGAPLPLQVRSGGLRTLLGMEVQIAINALVSWRRSGDPRKALDHFELLVGPPPK